MKILGKQCRRCGREFNDSGQYSWDGSGYSCRSRAKCRGVAVIAPSRSPQAPAWLRLAESILHWLEATQEPYLDRRAVQELFQVGRSEAHRIMQRIGGGVQLGAAKVVSRFSAIEYVRSIRSGKPYLAELDRRERVAVHLAAAQRDLHLRTITVAREDEIGWMRSATLDNLPGSIALSKNKLTMEFFGYEDLLKQIGQFLFALENDGDRIQTFVEGN